MHIGIHASLEHQHSSIDFGPSTCRIIFQTSPPQHNRLYPSHSSDHHSLIKPFYSAKVLCIWLTTAAADYINHISPHASSIQRDCTSIIPLSVYSVEYNMHKFACFAMLIPVISPVNRNSCNSFIAIFDNIAPTSRKSIKKIFSVSNLSYLQNVVLSSSS